MKGSGTSDSASVESSAEAPVHLGEGDGGWTDAFGVVVCHKKHIPDFPWRTAGNDFIRQGWHIHLT